MSAFVCESKAGRQPSLEAALAEVTTAVNDIVIFGNIRKGRLKEAVSRVGLMLSRFWSENTGTSGDHIEIALAECPAKYTFRYGKLPEPPYV